ncbi:MAG: Rieske (2Fe-2S) protein [Pararhizobium sp.]
MTTGNKWQPVSLSHAIEAGTSAGTRLSGEDLVVWRDKSGVAHVWEDRCPHRGMRLSFGFVRGDHIACLYHGWQYDTGGQCQYIPAHPDLEVPKTIKVPVYLTEERAGMIWTALAADAGPLTVAADVTGTVPVHSIYVDCCADSAAGALENSRLVPFSAARDSETTIAAVAPSLYAVCAGHDRLLVGIQSLSEQRTALHVVISGLQEVYQGSGQAHFLNWVLGLRYRIENPPKKVFPLPAGAVAEAL